MKTPDERAAQNAKKRQARARQEKEREKRGSVVKVVKDE